MFFIMIYGIASSYVPGGKPKDWRLGLYHAGTVWTWLSAQRLTSRSIPQCHCMGLAGSSRTAIRSLCVWNIVRYMFSLYDAWLSIYGICCCRNPHGSITQCSCTANLVVACPLVKSINLPFWLGMLVCRSRALATANESKTRVRIYVQVWSNTIWLY